MSTQQDALAYLKGKGKGHRAHTSGKGHGRRKNPRDKAGNIMKCHKCGSAEHLQRNCPNNQGGGHSAPPNLLAIEPVTTFFNGLELEGTSGAVRPEASSTPGMQPWDGSADLPCLSWTPDSLGNDVFMVYAEETAGQPQGLDLDTQLF